MCAYACQYEVGTGEWTSHGFKRITKKLIHNLYELTDNQY